MRCGLPSWCRNPQQQPKPLACCKVPIIAALKLGRRKTLMHWASSYTATLLTTKKELALDSIARAKGKAARRTWHLTETHSPSLIGSPPNKCADFLRLGWASVELHPPARLADILAAVPPLPRQQYHPVVFNIYIYISCTAVE